MGEGVKMDLRELAVKIKDEGETMVSQSGINESEKEKILLRVVKLNEEVGELCEEILNKFGNQRLDKHFDEKNLREEFADVVIVLMLLADKLGINVERALEDKVNKIYQRKK